MLGPFHSYGDGRAGHNANGVEETVGDEGMETGVGCRRIPANQSGAVCRGAYLPTFVGNFSVFFLSVPCTRVGACVEILDVCEDVKCKKHRGGGEGKK